MPEQPRNAEETARKFLQAGVSFIMIRTDGSKAPYESWEEWETARPGLAELERWFGGGKRRGIAMIAGAVSGNLEIIDIEGLADRAEFKRRLTEVDPALLARLIVVKTPSEGRHLIYRCSEIEGNQKLAYKMIPSDPSNKNARRLPDGSYAEFKTLIETRGPGGYVVAPGSPARCHKLNAPYVLLQGDYLNIPVITPDERSTLLAVSMSFDEDIQGATNPTKSIKAPDRPGKRRPGDDFSDQVNADGVATILRAAGWEPVKLARRGGEHWRRPGKSEGWSATLYESGVLHVFTSNAPPFAPDKSYSPFDVLALTHFNGDFGKCAKALASKGYGK